MSLRADSYWRDGAERLLTAVAETYNLTTPVVRRDRSPDVVRVRDLFVLLCRNFLELSYPRIAKVLGAHHTTAMAAVKRARRRLEREPDYCAAYGFIVKLFDQPDYGISSFKDMQ